TAQPRVLDALVDAVHGGTERARRLTDAVLVYEALADREPAAHLAPARGVGNPDVREAHPRMIRRHVEGPEVLLDLHARILARHQECRDAARVTVVAAGAGEQQAMRHHVHARGPHLLAVD